MLKVVEPIITKAWELAKQELRGAFAHVELDKKTVTVNDNVVTVHTEPIRVAGSKSTVETMKGLGWENSYTDKTPLGQIKAFKKDFKIEE